MGPELAPAPVLSTLNVDGSRRWLSPKLSHGRFLTARRVVGFTLIALFAALPWVRVGGEPAMLLDVMARRFVFFGLVLDASEAPLLMLVLLGAGFTVFALTALYGRVWCGWACPQTVYMELVFRPLDRFAALRRGALARLPAWSRRALVVVAYALLSLGLAHTFLAYFVGVDALAIWVRRSPLEHPASFAVMAVTTGLILLDFAYIREQMCTVACPYARLQSVLLDRDSLVVGYDSRRGEPRGKLVRSPTAGDVRGDCVDCKACVLTCPTGIDIRNGLQLECVACTQCIDACDSIMDNLGRPRGLIRYASQRELEGGGKKRLLRPRTVVYGSLALVAAVLLGSVLALRAPADVTVLRASGTPYIVTGEGQVVSTLLVRVHHRRAMPARYAVELVGASDATLHSAGLPLVFEGRGTAGATLVISMPQAAFSNGAREVRLRVSDGEGFVTETPYRLLGPFGGRS